jgi:hypothetical protein
MPSKRRTTPDEFVYGEFATNTISSGNDSFFPERFRIAFVAAVSPRFQARPVKWDVAMRSSRMCFEMITTGRPS